MPSVQRLPAFEPRRSIEEFIQQGAKCCAIPAHSHRGLSAINADK
jgi:hypothetical protein